jgi:hypothetical protein
LRVEDMSGDELVFLQSLESEQGEGIPKPFIMGKGGDVVRLAFNRKLNTVTSFRNWVVVNMKPGDFKDMVKNFVISVAIEDEMRD